MPDNIPVVYQWVALIVGLVAFVMAVIAMPTVFQMWLGKPRVLFVFEEDDSSPGLKVLDICLVNIPITNPLVKAIGVARMPAEDVCLLVEEISDVVTGQNLIDGFVGNIKSHFQSTPMPRVRLPASQLLSCCTLVKWVESKNTAYVVMRDKEMEIPTGQYIVKFELQVDAVETQASNSFLVGTNANEFMWVLK